MTASDPAVVLPTASEHDDATTRVLIALCVSSFLVTLNFFAATPFYPQISRDLGTTVPLLGQITTAMILLSAGIGLVAGPLADRYGYRWMLVIGILAVAVNFAGVGLATSYPVLLVVSVAGGVGDALVFGLPLAIVSIRFTGDAHRRAMGWVIGSLSMGPIIGGPVLTTLGDVSGWRTALIVAAFATLGAAWFVAVALPIDQRQPATRFRFRDLVSVYTPLLKHPPTMRLYTSSAFRAVTWLGLLTYLGAFLSDEIGLSMREIGLVFTISGGGFAVGGVVAGRLMARFTPRRVVVLACIVGSATTSCALLSGSVGVVLPLLFLTSIVSSISAIGIVIGLSAESPACPGVTMVFNGTTINLGTAAGSALGGVLIAVGGYHALALGLPLFALVAAVGAWWPSTPGSSCLTNDRSSTPGSSCLTNDRSSAPVQARLANEGL